MMLLFGLWGLQVVVFMALVFHRESVMVASKLTEVGLTSDLT